MKQLYVMYRDKNNKEHIQKCIDLDEAHELYNSINNVKYKEIASDTGEEYIVIKYLMQ